MKKLLMSATPLGLARAIRFLFSSKSNLLSARFHVFGEFRDQKLCLISLYRRAVILDYINKTFSFVANQVWIVEFQQIVNNRGYSEMKELKLQSNGFLFGIDRFKAHNWKHFQSIFHLPGSTLYKLFSIIIITGFLMIKISKILISDPKLIVSTLFLLLLFNSRRFTKISVGNLK